MGLDGQVLTPRGAVWGPWVFSAFCIVPAFAALCAVANDTMEEHIIGIVTLAATQFSVCGIAASMVDYAVSYSRRGMCSSKKSDTRSDEQSTYTHLFDSVASFASVVATTCGLLGFMSASILCLLSRSVSSDLGVPAAATLLLLVDVGVLEKMGLGLQIQTQPLAIVILVSTAWWVISAASTIFLPPHRQGELSWSGGLGRSAAAALMARQKAFANGADTSIISDLLLLRVLPDADVSLWSSDSLLYPLLSVVLTLLPLPAVRMSCDATLQAGSNGENLLMLALIACVTALFSMLWSIRLLGIAGFALGLLKLNDMSVVYSAKYNAAARKQ
jgi:hypothetical protein